MLIDNWLMKFGFCCVLMMLALLQPAPAFAALPEAALFQEAVGVKSQSPQDRQRAAGKALGRVLVRISGTRDVLQNSEVRGALGQAERYLEQYSYARPAGQDVQESLAYELIMDFQPQATTDILRKASQPVWSSRRPGILAWIEVSDGGSRQVVTTEGSAVSESMAAWATLVEAQARRRGLPVVLPTRSQVVAGGVGNLPALAQQSGASLVLAADLSLAGGGCSGEWSMVVDGEASRWRTGPGSQGDCVADAMDTVAETLSTKFAFAAAATGSAGSEPVLMQVEGIRGFADYTNIILGLGELAVVESVTVDSAASGRVRFSLRLKGGIDQLRQAVRIQGLLLETAPQPETFSRPAPAAVSVAPAAQSGAVASVPPPVAAPAPALADVLYYLYEGA